MTDVNILAIQPVSAAERVKIEGVDARVRLTDAGGWFDGEIRETWPAFTTRRYLRADAAGKGTRAERDALLAEAEIVLGGFPFPLDLRGRAPRLKWFHQRPAGASNSARPTTWDPRSAAPVALPSWKPCVTPTPVSLMSVAIRCQP